MKRLLWMASLACSLVGASAASAQTVVINELVYDSAGTDTATWTELKGTPGTDLTGWALVGINGNGGAVYLTVNLSGSIPPDGYFVVAQSAAVPNNDLVVATHDFQNGPDSIHLRDASGAILDRVAYQAHSGADIFAGETAPAPDQTGGPPENSTARCPDGFDSQDNSADFKIDTTPTPGTANDAVCVQIPVDYTICELRVDNANGVPVHAGEYVKTRGIVTTPSGTFSPTVQEFTITDGDCCLAVFGGAILPSVQVGDDVEVTGTMAHFNGRAEITSPNLAVTVLSSGNPVGPPTVISTFELSVNGENYESCLIRLECVSITDGLWPADGTSSNLTVDDGSGPVILRVDADTNIDGTPGPTGPFSVIGMGSQFDSSSPHTSGYQIFPRNLDDLLFDVCAPPSGACCFQDGACLVLSELECGQNNGIYQGNDFPCEPNPCPQPVGACCLVPRGVPCVVVTAAECAAQQGFYVGDGSVCEPNPCPLPLGACCYADGSCAQLTEQDCVAGGGVFYGDFEPCEPNPCPQPVGACCYADGSCVVYTEAECLASGGAYLGNGSGCEPNPCPQPTGACCVPEQVCVITTGAECLAMGGTYYGDGSVCTPDLCTPIPTEKESWGAIKQRYSR